MEVPYPLSDAFLGKISFKLAHIWSPGDTYPLLFILYLDKTQVVRVNPSAVASLSVLCSHTSGSPGSSGTSTVCFPTLGDTHEAPWGCTDALLSWLGAKYPASCCVGERGTLSVLKQFSPKISLQESIYCPYTFLYISLAEVVVVAVQLLSHVWVFVTPWTIALQVPLSFTISQSLLRFMPSHPLSSPSPPALSLSQHQGLFQWVSSSHQVAKLLELQLQHQSFQWIFRVDFL